MPLSSPPSNDHDLLVRLDTKLDALQVSVGEMRTVLPNKADTTRVDKLEERLEQHGKRLYLIAGGIATAELLLRYILK